jgi:hypothetical protein
MVKLAGNVSEALHMILTSARLEQIPPSSMTAAASVPAEVLEQAYGLAVNWFRHQRPPRMSFSIVDVQSLVGSLVRWSI